MDAKDKTFLGVDVSKATLDISLSGRHFQIKNTKDAISFFINENIVLKKIIPTLVCLESTGGIEQSIVLDKQLKQKRDLLMSYKGVGKQISNSLVVELPELVKLNRKEIASLVGVVPKTYESGIKKLNGHICGGRFYVRKALYMAALVANKHNPKMRTFYNRLINAGKAKKVALVAIIRKIIICLNAMIKNNSVYDEAIS